MQAARLATRLQRELRMLQTDPPPGVCAWPCSSILSHLEAQIQGPDETVYAKGIFKLEVRVPERYPFEPPNVKFRTPIYHPNIDSGGRICLDILNMPPKGAWKPSLNIPTILASIGLLLAEPNPDDGLMGDITAEYKHNRASFDAKARKWTEQYAVQNRLEDGAHQIGAVLQPDAGEQEISTTKAIETTSLPKESHCYSFGLAFSGECAQETSRGVFKGSTQKQPSTGKLENPVSTNQKLNLSMKLTRGKGGKVLERESTADAAATEDSQPNSSIHNSHAIRPALALQDKFKSVEMGLSNSTSVERAKSSGASSSTANASLPGVTVVETGITENSPRSPCIEEAQAIKQVPFRFNKPSATTSVDLSKFKRPRESTTSLAPSENEVQKVLVNPKVPSILSGPSTASDSAPVKKPRSASENGGHSVKQSSRSLSKLYRSENGSGRPQAENLSRGMGTGLTEHADSTARSASGNSAETTVRSHNIQEMQKQVSNASKHFSGNSSQASSRQLQVDSEPLQRQAVQMEAQKASNSPTLLQDKPSKESLGQLGVENLSRELGTRSIASGKERISMATERILNQEVEFSDGVTSNPVAAASRNGTTTAKPVTLDVEKHTRGTAKISMEESSKSTEASPQCTGIQKQKVMDIIHEAEAHVPSIPEIPCAALQNQVGPLLSSGLSRVAKTESAKAPAQAEKPSTGVGNKAALTKKTGQIDPAALIVLDSESDEEPPKGRSRLSLANRKGMKRK